ncbi:gtp-binding protein hsr1-like protein : GTP-binding protein HSR1-related protein OS=Rhodopirellula maiorica SM1 GN=RMSM_06255 PE=4 SV=1: MMR_HSR1 [Gemmataceae bacterium]|nr:gtp-binding protein hsr1-like protein : GTP-binding protein HSR1-related protein OS=Rhodopirellula maiorica SM1 GN=RMSM_06255 PE=4 SV=1: MMR_HSR1 [Gemmataceae bacterium]VTT97788.1 gtp-binding protein hsr1-like protein : GTP-binding protein HSR1-related protein OS=Rhodopirellula maiorica SM1 GN=RMSM_06255 PE=4 SV=1: MMR_HSR1 [Gemmataceae bacterium]
MNRLRLVLLALLFLTPFAALIGVGSYHLWEVGYLWVWWPLLGCFALAYFLAWRWTRRGSGVLPDTDVPPPEYWTDRDRVAWEKVDAKAKSFAAVSLDQISNAKHYTDLSLELATEVGKVFNPGSDDPFDTLTLPEVLACVELAAADLDGMVQKYVPGVHLLRIRDVKRAQKAYKLYRTGQDVYWAGAAVFDPVSTGLRYLASRAGLGTLMDRIQSNVLLWFHTAYIHQVGRYLIELNSGRLKVGVKRYREILAAHQEPPPDDTAARTAPVTPGAVPDPAAPAADGTAPPPAKAITIAVLGHVKAGKSSLVNALLGKQLATVDRLPVASGVRYDATLPGGQPVTLFDTSGYGEKIRDEDFAAAVEASRDADLILLVTPATSPGRVADVDLLDRLTEWFAGKPHLRTPPIVAVVNQVDLLSPKAEWSPPYDWAAGQRPKEVNVRDCVAAVREQVGPQAAEIVPVCARSGEAFGIVEGLVPVIVSHLDHARGAAILKAFDTEANERPIGKVADQLGTVVTAGLGALAGWLNKKK